MARRPAKSFGRSRGDVQRAAALAGAQLLRNAGAAAYATDATLERLESRTLFSIAFQNSNVYAATGDNPSQLAVADFTSDGHADIVSANNSSGGKLTLFINNGNGTFKAGTSLAGAPSSTQSVFAGDFNNDGKADIA